MPDSRKPGAAYTIIAGGPPAPLDPRTLATTLQMPAALQDFQRVCAIGHAEFLCPGEAAQRDFPRGGPCPLVRTPPAPQAPGCVRIILFQGRAAVVAGPRG